MATASAWQGATKEVPAAVQKAMEEAAHENAQKTPTTFLSRYSGPINN
jgi:ribosomal protein S5